MIYLFIVLLFCIAGFFKSVSDRVGWSDLFSNIPFLSRAFTGVKDKNNDGKVSFVETYFPIDGWHLSEWGRIIPFAIASGFCVAKIEPCYQVFWVDFVSNTVLLIGYYNVAFIIFYNLLPKIK